MGGQAMKSGANELVGFYEEAYSHEGDEALVYARWRALGAKGKADHAIELCERAGIAPASTLDVGCGDGALLAELAARGFGGRVDGVEIAQGAVEIARKRNDIGAVELYDGRRLTYEDGAYELGIVSHVLEHVADPSALLAEVARVCEVVVVEVPLEDNASARRRGKRERARAVGHLQRLSRGSARAIASSAGLSMVGELEDALPLAVHRFFAQSRSTRARATIKWGVRRGLHRVVAPLARRLFTVHYACLCVSPTSRQYARLQKLAGQPNDPI